MDTAPAAPLLAVDIGNSDIKLGLFDAGGTLRWQHRLADHGRSAAFLAEAVGAILREETSFSPHSRVSVAYCSTVPDLNVALQEACRQALADRVLDFFEAHPPRIHVPIRTGAYPLEQLGPDRLVNLCAVAARYPGEVALVLDFGTATTVNALSARGEFLGGAIAPGLKTLAQSLQGATAKLPLADLFNGTATVSTVLGQSTAAGLQAGVGIGYVGLIQELVTRMQSELVEQGEALPRMVMTGGLADTFCRWAGGIFSGALVDPTLTLEGLAGLYRLNRVSEASQARV